MIRFEANEGGKSPVQIWVLPDAQHRYCMGADVAEGLDHGDYSDASVLDANTGELVAKWHGHIPPREFGHQLALLGRFYNNALIGCEANNHGLSTIDALRDLKYPRLYRRRSLDSTSKKATLKWGWYTNKQTKPLMIDGLDQALRDDAIIVYDRNTFGELRTYIRDEKGYLHGSPHDDRVVSLAIAVQMLDYVNSSEVDEFQIKDDRGTFDWWLRQANAADAPDIQPIGYHQRRNL